MKRLLFIFLVFFVTNIYAKDKLLLTINTNDCYACTTFIMSLEDIDTNKIDVYMIYEKRYLKDKLDLENMYNFKKVKVNFIFDDSLYSSYIMGESSSFNFIYKEDLFYGNFIKNGLQKTIISRINDLYKDYNIMQNNAVPISNTVNYFKQYGHEIWYIHPLKNTINSFSTIEYTNRELLKFDQTLLKYAFDNFFTEESLKKEIQYFRNNNLDLNVKINSFYRDEENFFWVSTIHNVLLTKDADTIMMGLQGMYKFDSNFNFISFYSNHSVEINNDLTFNFENVKYVSTVYDFFMKGDTLYSNVSKWLAQHSEPNLYYGQFVLDNKSKFSEYKLLNHPLPKNYSDFGYNFSNIKYSNKYNYYTLPLEDKLYFTNYSLEPIHLNLFTEQTKRLASGKRNNYISNPIEHLGNVHFIYHTNSKFYYAIYNLKNNLISFRSELIKLQDKLNAKNSYFLDNNNPNYLFFINNDGYFERILIK